MNYPLGSTTTINIRLILITIHQTLSPNQTRRPINTLSKIKQFWENKHSRIEKKKIQSKLLIIFSHLCWPGVRMSRSKNRWGIIWLLMADPSTFTHRKRKIERDTQGNTKTPTSKAHRWALKSINMKGLSQKNINRILHKDNWN